MVYPARRISLAVAAALLAAAAAACSPGYVVRGAFEQARILERSEPISAVLHDERTPPEVRRKLELVTQARTFAVHGLGLNAGHSFTSYSYVDSDTLLLVLSAARPDRFEAYTWWFPIVGHVPYKGFFDFAEAHRTAESLAAAGYDTYVRPAAAFSTLGWFNDPLLNTVLRFGDVDLVDTVIHELLHNTVFLSGQVAFNESFANFVGGRGAIAFFCAREGEDSEPCRQALAGWHDMRIFGAFLNELVADLERLYARDDVPLTTLLFDRERIFDTYRSRFETEIEAALRTRGFRWFTQRPLNNASLIGVRLYYRELDLFEAVYDAHDGDLRAAIHAIIAAVRSSPATPFEAVARLATRSATGWSRAGRRAP